VVAQYPILDRQQRKAPVFDESLSLPSKPEIEKNILGGILSNPNPNQTFAVVSQLLKQ
jgi:hypothetical protein